MFELVFAASMVACPGIKPTPSPAVAEFLGEDAVAVLEAPIKVELVELAPSVPGVDHGESEGIVAVDGRQEVPLCTGVRLGRVFLQNRAYRFSSERKCEFDPTFALRFTGRDHVVDVLLAFDCGKMRLVLANSDGRVVMRKWEEFDRIQDRLVRMIQRTIDRGPVPATVQLDLPRRNRI